MLTAADDRYRDAVRRWEGVPKAELHLHLEGAIPLPALWSLVEKYGCDPPMHTLGDLERRFVYRDFVHFLETWVWKTQFLREAGDLEFAAEAVALDLARQNVVHAEAFCSPPDLFGHGFSIAEIVTAIRRGLSRVPEVTIRLIPDLIRGHPPGNMLRWLAEIDEVRDQGVIGVGLGGFESRFPPEPYAPVFEEARRRGFRTTAHAGEGAGAASVRGVLEVLHVDRIGHGTRAFEDPELVDTLRARRVPLECCPISNVRTRVVEAIAAHPIRGYFDAGLLVTLNTDDPAMFQTSLALECAALEVDLGFTPTEIRVILANAAEAAWLDPDARVALRDRLAPETASLTG